MEMLTTTQNEKRNPATRARRAGAIVAALFLVGGLFVVPSARGQETPRAKTLSGKLMCVCGCNQILGACNHVGCSYSHGMIQEVDERVARNESDDLTLQDFVQEYGPTVLAEPPTKGFNRVAWIMPVVFPLVSLYLLWEVVRRWRRRSAVATAGGPNVSAEFLARARNEAGKESDE
jgi:cytochrome c-type biogenesis protein CcmH